MSEYAEHFALVVCMETAVKLDDSEDITSCFIHDSLVEDTDFPSPSWGFSCCGGIIFLIQL